MNAADIAGYTYDCQNLHPACLVEQLIGEELAAPAARAMHVEDVLSQIIANGELSDRLPWVTEYPWPEDDYDSGDFPKVIFDDMVTGWEKCDRCNDPL